MAKFIQELYSNIQLELGLAVAFTVFLVCKYFWKRMNKETGLEFS